MTLAAVQELPATALGTAPDSARVVRKVPLALKFAAAFVGLVTLVLLVNGAVNLWLSYEEAKRAALRVQQEKAHAASERIDQFVSEIESQIGWTTRQEWRRIGIEQQRYDFIRLLRQAPPITELSYLDGNGREQLKVSRLEPDAVGSNADFSADPRFTKAVADKVWFGPVYFRRGSEPYMTLAVAHAGRSAGVTVAEVNLKLIWDVIDSIRIGEQGHAFVVNAQGKLIAHPDMSLVLRDTDLSRMPQIAAALASPPPTPQALRSGQPQASTAAIGESLDGQSVLTAYDAIPRLGWIVFVQSPVREAMAPVYTALTQTGILLALGLVLALTAGTFLARRMADPIQRLQGGAERFGQGDLSQRIAIRTGDEIETLADRFNLMASRIQDSYETLEAKVEERTRDLNEALQQQTATAEVLKVISRSAFDLRTVLETLIESACHLCKAEMGLISLAKDGVFLPEASYGTPPGYLDFMRANPFKPGRETFSGRAAVTGAVVNVADALEDAEYTFSEARDRAGYRAMLAVPLLRQGEVIGVFAMPRRTPGAFSDRQVELVQTFADQAVIAIENVRLFEEVEARTRELSEALEQQTATADVLKVISRSAFDLQTVLDTLCASAVRLCDADKGVIFQRDGDDYRLVANHGFSPEFEEFARANPFRADRGSTAGRVALEGRTIHVADVLADPEYTATGHQKHGGYRTNLGVPLLREGTPIGVFVLTRPEVKPFTERQVDLIASFADQAVIAMENARLFKAVKRRTKELKRSLEDLQAAQDRLVQTEKLASLGQLTAGIAHEIKNPLNFVNNFSSLSSELVEELQEALAGAPLDDKTRADIEEITGLLRGNLDKVVHHGRRADSIVKNMLLHSREGSGERRSVDLNATVEESLNLAYHGARAEKPGFNVTLQKSFDPAVGSVEIFPQEFIRVLLNLVSNGFYAAAKKKTEGGDPSYEPTLSASTRALEDGVEIRIRDNGTGIPDEVKAKMFNPFFTTKPAGEGTGLGLSLSHDIVVKQHGGTIAVETEPGAFTEFVITLPRAAHAIDARRAS